MSRQPHRFCHVGQTYRDFKVTKAIEISELQCHLCELVHEPSLAQIVHISNDDPENLFCLSFQTIPETSNGVAHILEHTVLCGSKKFPIKDPFFAMSRRSLNTFMNALTGADFTCYPAATQEPKDFYNLLEVYLDAVFHPNLQKFSFLQEGWRLEFSTPNDPTTPLEYKGIVFNEMKGAMSSPEARLEELIHQALFPDITYGYNSGGNPQDIPSLTYEELKAFHKKFYHPSRCLFFFYGDMPLEKHLDFIEKEILKDTTKQPPLPPIPRQPRFISPRYVTGTYPISPEEEGDKTLIAFGWLTCEILNQEEVLALSIIEFALLDTDASPLKKALLKSGLCKQISSHIDSELSEMPFIITLRGCDEKNAPIIEILIKTTLERIASEGIALQQIENALHQMEFHRSEITHDHGPFGLSLFMRSALAKQHGAHSESGLYIHSLSELIRKRHLGNPNYFSDLIRKYLCENPHFAQVVLVPSPTMASEEIAQERGILESIKASLSPSETEKIISQAEKLSAFQEMQEEADENVLPKVTLADVSKTPRDYSLQQEQVGNLEIFYHNTFTNGIVYADLIYDLPEISEEELPFVRLFAYLITQMGCGPRNYSENLEYIQEHTGGVKAALMFNLQAHNPISFSPSLCIRGKALHRKAPKLFQLFIDITQKIDFTDHTRLREVISKLLITLQNGVHHHSLQYAINLSSSCLDLPSRIAHAWYGLEFYYTIKKLQENFDKSIPELANILLQLQKRMLCLEKPHLVLTCEAEFYDTLKQHHFYGLDAIPTKRFPPWKADYSLHKIPSQGRITASPVAFTGRVLKTIPYTHPDAPALQLAAFLCNNLILHTKIREQGGAYGSGAVANSIAANFYFFAYRDPNITTTLEAFDEALLEIGKGNFEESDLEEAKLEMLQGLDAPITPGEHGSFAYSWMREGRSYDVRAQFRTRLLTLTVAEVTTAVKAHLVPHISSGVTVVFAGKELLEVENKLLQEIGRDPLVLKYI